MSRHTRALGRAPSVLHRGVRACEDPRQRAVRHSLFSASATSIPQQRPTPTFCASRRESPRDLRGPPFSLLRFCDVHPPSGFRDANMLRRRGVYPYPASAAAHSNFCLLYSKFLIRLFVPFVALLLTITGT